MNKPVGALSFRPPSVGGIIARVLFFELGGSPKRLHIGGMAKDRILIKPVGWEVFLVQDGRNILLAFAGSEAQAKRYAKQAEAEHGLKKKKKKK